MNSLWNECINTKINVIYKNKCHLFLYPEILTFCFLIFLMYFSVEDTFSVSLLMASASKHPGSYLSVSLELFWFPLGQAICVLHVTLWAQPLCPVTKNYLSSYGQDSLLNKVLNQSRERPFTFWILKIVLS